MFHFLRKLVILSEVKDLKNWRKIEILDFSPSRVDRWFAMLSMTAYAGQTAI